MPCMWKGQALSRLCSDESSVRVVRDSIQTRAGVFSGGHLFQLRIDFHLRCRGLSHDDVFQQLGQADEDRRDIPFLALTTIYFGLRDRRAAHRRLARITFPLWLYVSVTGVVVYFMLYQLFPPHAERSTMPTALIESETCLIQ